MNINIVPLALIVAVPMAMMTPPPVRGDETIRTDAEVNGSVAGLVQPSPGLAGGKGPLEAELIKLLRTDFATPQARQQSIRQWRTANAAALKVEIDARSEAQRPERERREADARVRLATTLDAQIAAGNIGSLQAEFIRLVKTPFDSPKQRRAAIDLWQAQKGAALESEMQTHHANDAPRLVALKAEAYARRQQQIAAAVASGRLGPREAELQQFSQNPVLDPAAKQESLRSWLAAHRAELKKELGARGGAVAIPSDASAP